MACLPLWAVKLNGGQVLSSADVGRVHQQALPPTQHREGEFRDRGIRYADEGRAQALVLGIDVADEVDLDLAIQFGDQVRQGSLTSAGTEVNGALQRFVEQRGGHSGASVDGAARTFPRGELGPGADTGQVGILEELRVRQLHRGAGDVRVRATGRVFHHRPQRRVAAALRGTIESERDSRLEPEVVASAHLEAA